MVTTPSGSVGGVNGAAAGVVETGVGRGVAAAGWVRVAEAALVAAPNRPNPRAAAKRPPPINRHRPIRPAAPSTPHVQRRLVGGLPNGPIRGVGPAGLVIGAVPVRSGLGR